LNKCFFATAGAWDLLSAVAASPPGLPPMLQATTDQPSYVNQMPSRDQNADAAALTDPQAGRPTESRDSGLVSRRPSPDPQEINGGGYREVKGDGY